MKLSSKRKGQPGPGKGLVGGQYKPLTVEDVKRIHEASLAILDRTGVQVDDPETLRLFEDAGAEVDGTRVRLSSSLVEDSIAKAPSRVVLAGREEENDL
ncbi:MAG: trimethylamine methyltransferase family protein, partial [Anaerolineales bacterium]|nr:trimethylamine methyltransferase family protein [Anaerolineales bacterium]